jgi:hypothetical protein
VSLLLLLEEAADPLVALPGELVLTGMDAGLSLHDTLTAEPGALVLTGNPGGLFIHRRLVAQSAALVLTGSLASLRIVATIPQWPCGDLGDLPLAPLREGFEEEYGDTTGHGSFNIGPNPTRRRNTARVRTAAVRFDLEVAQKKTLTNFYTGPCQSGAKRFRWVDWADGGTPALYRFVPPLRFVPLGDVWEAQFTLEMLPWEPQA